MAQAELIIAGRRQVQITACPHPFRMARVDFSVDAGLTRSQALRAAPAVRQALDPEVAELKALATAIARAGSVVS